MSTTMVASQDQTETKHDFEACDTRGRRIGSRVWTRTVTFEAVQPNHDECECTYRLEPGVYFAWSSSATRDGKQFGGGSGCHERFFKTEAERSQQIAKYLKDAAKRAAKK